METASASTPVIPPTLAAFNRCVVHFADRSNLTLYCDSMRVRERYHLLHSGDVFIERAGRVVEHDRGVTRRQTKLDRRGGISVVEVQGRRDAIFGGERAAYPPQGVGRIQRELARAAHQDY